MSAVDPIDSYKMRFQGAFGHQKVRICAGNKPGGELAIRNTIVHSAAKICHNTTLC
jgi:hypothetical protein